MRATSNRSRANHRCLSLLLPFLLLSCGHKADVGTGGVDVEKAKEALMQVDRLFSEVSVKEGTRAAFDMFMGDSATMLTDNRNPITERDAILALFPVESTATLEWEPLFADVSGSGDLGYTVGRWTYRSLDSTGAERTAQGHYVTIWKKQADGSWKYVFDTGTDGVPEEK